MSREWLERLLADCRDLTAEDAQLFCDCGWLQPQEGEQELDAERARLIQWLRRTYEPQDEALELMLHLIDQLYGVRSRMQCLAEAISRQPRQVQAEIFTCLIENKNIND
jgi:chaperone modulatory protein CbpM